MIKLEYLEKEDLEKIVEWNANKSADFLLQWSGPKYSFPLTIRKIEDYFLKEVKKENSSIFIYKILVAETDDFIGTIELRELDKLKKVGKVCRFLIGEENYRGMGIGKQVLREALRIGFENLNFEKITLGVFDFNLGAMKCYESVGFIKEKYLENNSK